MSRSVEEPGIVLEGHRGTRPSYDGRQKYSETGETSNRRDC